HRSEPDTLFLQHHWGVYRSDDFGGDWREIGDGLPSTFGFPIVVHPGRPGTAYVLPLESDEFRCTPDARLRVYRTTDGGGSWQPRSPLPTCSTASARHTPRSGAGCGTSRGSSGATSTCSSVRTTSRIWPDSPRRFRSAPSCPCCPRSQAAEPVRRATETE